MSNMRNIAAETDKAQAIKMTHTMRFRGAKSPNVVNKRQSHKESTTTIAGGMLPPTLSAMIQCDSAIWPLICSALDSNICCAFVLTVGPAR
jgi:hypothetical protein